MRVIPCVMALVVACVLGGCIPSYSDNWTAYSTMAMPPVEQPARVVKADVTTAEQKFNQLNLPHQTIREKGLAWFDMQAEMERCAGLTDEYYLIGCIGIGGNANTTSQSVQERVAKKAAEYGGDLAILYREGLTDAVLPGYSISSYGRYSAFSTYVPPQNVKLPSAGAFVLRYVPGTAARRVSVRQFTDAQWQWFDDQCKAGEDPKYSSDRLAYFKEVVVPALSRVAAGPHP